MLITTIKSLGCHQGEFRCLLVLEVMEINVPWPRIYLVWYLGVSGLPSWQGEIYPLLCTFTANKGGFCHFFFFFLSTEDGPLCARIIQTSSRSNIVSIFACKLIGSRYFKFNQKCCHVSKCDVTENANCVICWEAGEEEKNQIITQA